MTTSLRAAALLHILFVLTPIAAVAQFPPDTFTNLRVFPDTITQRELLARMRAFTFALGVECRYCHAGDESVPFEETDFASDEKPAKEIARQMLRMLAAIEREHLASLPARDEPEIRVRCVTCHRGLPRPVLIQDVLERAIAVGGADSAVAEYRSLREAYHGSGSYDFSAETLNEFAAGRLRAQEPGEAVSLLELSTELNPGSLTAHFYLGEAYWSRGDTTRAVGAYRRALEIEPGHAFIRSLIERLTGTGG